jgi:HEAT repeats
VSVILRRSPRLLAVLLALSPRVWADAPLPVNAPAGVGQQALSVSLVDGEPVAASCPAAPCSKPAVPLGLPRELRGKPSRGQVVVLGEGRRAVVVSTSDGMREFKAVVAAPLGSGAPKLLFSGLVGLTSGQEGSRSGPMVQISEPDDAGARRIVVGEQHEAVSLCGRPTVLSPRVLDPKDLELKAAKVQRLSVAERDAARQVEARRVADGEASTAAASVLTVLAASSAVGAPQALTDGDVETTWSENLGGTGRGEFVVMRAPPELPLTGLELTIRPKTSEVENGASPRQLFLVGPKEVVHVTLPEDAWQSPGARYQVALQPPLQSSCLALVLDNSYAESSAARVTIAELSVVSELSAGELPALVAALAGGGQRAEAAKALLAASGVPGFTAVAAAFGSLDEGGRRVALEVLDRAPCQLSAPVYVQALTGRIDAQARHAERGLRRCGAASGDALEQALAKVDKSDKHAMPLLVSELTLVDPARAVRAFLPLMNEKTVLRRRLLRAALAQAARLPAAAGAVRSALADPSLPDVAVIDLLRALGDGARGYEPQASAALARLLGGAPSFRSRFLLLGPLSALSGVSANADAAFRRRLTDEQDARVRAAALSLVSEPARFRPELLGALGASDVRVREASVKALGAGQGAFAQAALTERLEEDRWPLVRAASADALGRLPSSAAVDQALTSALDDDSPLVRARSVRALGDRGVFAAAPRVRDRLIDDQEWPEVRAAAARSLGALCDVGSLDELGAFAAKLADPMASPDAQLIAAGAVLALGAIGTPQAAALLTPLTDKKAPPQARRAARAALSARNTCRSRAAKP